MKGPRISVVITRTNRFWNHSVIACRVDLIFEIVR